VSARGGIVLAQDPEDALYPGMPASVLDVVAVQKTGTAREIGLEIALLAGQDVADVALSRDRELELEAGMAGLDPDAISDPQPLGTASGFSCPDCQGGLFELGPGDRQLRFRCRVGHAWTAVSLLAEQDASLEHALWMALRSLEEKAALGRRMASAAETRGSERTAGHYRRSAEEALQATGTLRQLLLAQPAQVGPDLAEPATVPRSGEPDGREELHQQ
jgi:two-component system chemotaxis response regulator CheB